MGKVRYTYEQRSRGGKNKPRKEEEWHEVVARGQAACKGQVVTRGVYYINGKSNPFVMIRSTAHAQQFDVYYNGRLVDRAGKESLRCQILRKRAREV